MNHLLARMYTQYNHPWSQLRGQVCVLYSRMDVTDVSLIDSEKRLGLLLVYFLLRLVLLYPFIKHQDHSRPMIFLGIVWGVMRDCGVRASTKPAPGLSMETCQVPV